MTKSANGTRKVCLSRFYSNKLLNSDLFWTNFDLEICYKHFYLTLVLL